MVDRERSDDPADWSAWRQRSALSAGTLSAVDLLDAHLRRIELENPAVNAIVTMDLEAAVRSAAKADECHARGEELGALHGLPVVIKDTEETKGLRTTSGSPLLADNIPDRDAIVVERVRAAGAVVLGKSNVPEFAAGSHTVNPVFGLTRNPYDPSRSAGGSSGGAAAALASGMSALATGSDMGGSLRNPAAFCNVVGLRPTLGRVPTWPTEDSWQTMIVNGPMGRTVRDAALLLSVLAGEDIRNPLSLPGDGSEFLTPLDADLTGIRVGWSRTLDGLDIDPEITAVLDEHGRAGLQAAGATLIDLEPAIAEFDDAFRVLRGFDFAQAFGRLVDDNPGRVGANIVDNVAWGRSLTLDDLGRAKAQRSILYHRFRGLFEEIDVLAAPATAVPAFDAHEPWVRSIAGVPQRDYLEWMRTAWRITPTGFPALSVPSGFTSAGLPVGLQLIAPPRAEMTLLRLAHEFEAHRPFWRMAPPSLGGARDAGPTDAPPGEPAGRGGTSRI